MNSFLKTTVISVLGPVALVAGLVGFGNLSSISVSNQSNFGSQETAYLPGVPTDTTHPPIPNPPSAGNGDAGFYSIPGIFLIFDTPEKDLVKPEFKAAEKKEFYWAGFDDTELGTKKAQKNRNSQILVERYGKLTPAYEFIRADGTYVSSITKTPLKRAEIIAVLTELRSRMESDNNNFEHIDAAREAKPTDISDGVGSMLQENMLLEFKNQIATSDYSLIVACAKSKESKSIEKTAKKAGKKVKPNRLPVLLVNTRDWLDERVLSALELKGPTEGVTYLVIDRQQKIVGRVEASSASVEVLIDFIKESIARLGSVGTQSTLSRAFGNHNFFNEAGVQRKLRRCFRLEAS